MEEKNENTAGKLKGNNNVTKKNPDNDEVQSDEETGKTHIKNAHAAGVGALERNEDQIGFEKTEPENTTLEGGDKY